MTDMIDITDVNLVEFAQKVYELSSPQGMGFLHYTDKPLTKEEAQSLIDEHGHWALNMDYVKGRACKMTVGRKDGRLLISNSWYDHTDRIFQQLLNHFGIEAPKITDHGCACNCIDCQSVVAET